MRSAMAKSQDWAVTTRERQFDSSDFTNKQPSELILAAVLLFYCGRYLRIRAFRVHYRAIWARVVGRGVAVDNFPVFADEAIDKRHAARRGFKFAAIFLRLRPFTTDVSTGFAEHFDTQTGDFERDV